MAYKIDLNLELRNIHYSASLSEETNAYSADVYLDGKKVCTVSNHGQGSCDDQYWLDPDAEAKVTAAFKALPMRDTGMELHGEPFMVQPDLEDWCGTEVAVYLSKRDFARHTKKKVLVVVPGETGEYEWKIDPAKLTAVTTFRDREKPMTYAAYILSKSKPGARIVNLMTPAEVDAYILSLIHI